MSPPLLPPSFLSPFFLLFFFPLSPPVYTVAICVRGQRKDEDYVSLLSPFLLFVFPSLRVLFLPRRCATSKLARRETRFFSLPPPSLFFPPFFSPVGVSVKRESGSVRIGLSPPFFSIFFSLFFFFPYSSKKTNGIDTARVSLLSFSSFYLLLRTDLPPFFSLPFLLPGGDVECGKSHSWMVRLFCHSFPLFPFFFLPPSYLPWSGRKEDDHDVRPVFFFILLSSFLFFSFFPFSLSLLPNNIRWGRTTWYWTVFPLPFFPCLFSLFEQRP